MMQDYDFATPTPTTVDAAPQPSQQVLRNILNFARCCQNISVGDMTLKVYLN